MDLHVVIRLRRLQARVGLVLVGTLFFAPFFLVPDTENLSVYAIRLLFLTATVAAVRHTMNLIRSARSLERKLINIQKGE